ncbi:Protein of unknown function, partial [Gryllus bimaculatus]
MPIPFAAVSTDLEEAPRTDKGEDDGSWIDEEFLKYILDPKATILKINVERATRKAALTKQEQESDGSWIDEGILKQILKQGASIQRVDVERATGKGDNYLSIIYRVRAEYQLQDSDHVHCKRLIIKGLPD